MESSSHRGAPVCLVCEGQDLTRYTTVRGHDIFRCATCGGRQVHPLPPEEEILGYYNIDYFEKGGEGYPDYMKDEASHRHTARSRLADLRTHVSEGRILDVGCAAGLFLDEAGRVGFETKGIETNPEMAEIARDRFGLDVAVGELKDLAVGAAGERPGDFSAVTFYNVLAHIRDPLQALRMAHDLLRPGGVLVVETWDAESPPARLLGRRWHMFNPPTVLYYLGRRTLPRLLERVGFETVASISGGKRLSLRHGLSVLSHMYPNRAVRAVENYLGRSGLADRIHTQYGGGQLLTVFARRRD